VHLLIVILHHEEALDDVLSTLVELELPDSIVIDAATGLGLLEHDLPVFAGVRALIPGGLDFCRAVLCLIEGDEEARQVLAALPASPAGALPGEPRSTAIVLPISGVRHL